MTRSALLVLSLLAASATTARADVEDELGLGAQPAALAGAVGALPIGYAGVHYAPATLALEDPGDLEPGFVELSVGFVGAWPVVDVTGMDGADIELAVEPRRTASATIGTRFDLGHAFGLRGLHAAISLYSPVSKVFAYSIHPDDSVQWLNLTDRNQHLSFHAGLGLRIASWLSLGASVRVLFDLETFTTGEVNGVIPEMDGSFSADTRLGEDVRVFGRVAPILSAASRPIPELALAFTWRAEIEVDDWGWTRTTATAGLPSLGYVHRFVHFYRPHEFVLGASYEATRSLVLTSDVTLGLWSNSISKNFDALEGRWGDTITPAVGARYRLSDAVELLGGYRFVPAAFDNFGGPTNFLDNDQHVGALGTEIALGPLADDDDLPFVARASFRLAYLVEREELKDWMRFESDFALERNPGYPGYSFGGVVPSMQLELEASW